MNKKVLVIALAVAMLALPVSAAFATKPEIVVEGKFFWTGPPVFDVSRETPNGMILRGTVPLMYTGSFEGPAVGEFVWNGHAKQEEPGVTGNNFHTIDTASGSLVLLLTMGNGKWRIISGTGDYENIHGKGTLMADESTPAPMDFIYTGTVHFDPELV